MVCYLFNQQIYINTANASDVVHSFNAILIGFSNGTGGLHEIEVRDYFYFISLTCGVFLKNNDDLQYLSKYL